MTGMETELGWSRTLLSSGATLGLIAMAAGNLFGGMLVDRYGARKLLACGLVALGIGMLGVASTRSPTLYVVMYGVFAGWVSASWLARLFRPLSPAFSSSVAAWRSASHRPAARWGRWCLSQHLPFSLLRWVGEVCSPSQAV
jgi:MFS family permease